MQHKILTGLLGFVLFCTMVSSLGGGSKGTAPSGSTRTATPSAKTAAPSPASDASSAPTSEGASAREAGDTQTAVASAEEGAPIGTPVRDGKFEFTVTKVVRGQSVAGTDEFMQQKAQGEYTFVHVTVKNIGDRSQSMMDDNQDALDAKGTQYSVDSTAGMALDDNDVWLTDINPGNQVKGVLVFDAPTGTKLTKIEFHDSIFSGGVEASLE